MWAELVRQSMGGLHVFLPLRDMGIDGVVHRLADGAYLPLQVKGRTSLTGAGQVHVTVTSDRDHLENRVYVRRSSFRSSPSTFICVLGWNRDLRRFEDDCLVIPSVELPDVAREDGEWLVLELEPGAMRHRRTDRYRVSLPSLGQTLESMLA